MWETTFYALCTQARELGAILLRAEVAYTVELGYNVIEETV
jgi:hypothetical protein